jgi:hypothetical protein
LLKLPRKIGRPVGVVNTSTPATLRDRVWGGVIEST